MGLESSNECTRSVCAHEGYGQHITPSPPCGDFAIYSSHCSSMAPSTTRIANRRGAQAHPLQQGLQIDEERKHTPLNKVDRYPWVQQNILRPIQRTFPHHPSSTNLTQQVQDTWNRIRQSAEHTCGCEHIHTKSLFFLTPTNILLQPWVIWRRKMQVGRTRGGGWSQI